MNDRELMQMALDALEEYEDGQKVYFDDEIEALRARLAQPEPEPVACDCDATAWCAMYKKCHRKMLGLKPFVNSPQREWQGLTDEEIETEAARILVTLTQDVWPVALSRAIEAKLKEKNA